MIKKSFFAQKPRFEYEAVSSIATEAERIPIPDKVTLFLKKPFDSKVSVAFKNGDRVKTGQKITLYPDSEAYVISSVTGTISGITAFQGDFGQSYTAISINTEPEDEFDDAFSKSLDEGLDTAGAYLGSMPGDLPSEMWTNSENHIDTIVISGVEKDLLIGTSQFAMKSGINVMNTGISALKKITGVHKVVIALPQSLVQEAGAAGGASGVELRVIDTEYPASQPRMIMKDVMGQVVPADKSCEDLGIWFVNAEAVASLGKAITEKQIPVTKILTFINKDLSKVMVKARIGTPVSAIFKALNVNPHDKDRIIVGGPMTGSAIYSEDHPVCTDTDAIMIQDGSAIPPINDTPCINCGDCIRVCPANIPVNMLIRLLEAGEYDDAVDEYDLYSCIECGLCSYVCVSGIPIFQYIRLAKYELDRVRADEEVADV